MVRLEAKVLGTVQGVFFRVFTTRAAEAAGVVGTVRNLDDGSVEIIAEGEKKMLHAFLDRVRTGHRYADIKDMVVEWKDATGEFSEFKIVF